MVSIYVMPSKYILHISKPLGYNSYHVIVSNDYNALIHVKFKCIWKSCPNGLVEYWSVSFSGLISWKCNWITWWFECNHMIIWHSYPLLIDLLILSWDYLYIQDTPEYFWALIGWYTSQFSRRSFITIPTERSSLGWELIKSQTRPELAEHATRSY